MDPIEFQFCVSKFQTSYASELTTLPCFATVADNDSIIAQSKL